MGGIFSLLQNVRFSRVPASPPRNSSFSSLGNGLAADDHRSQFSEQKTIVLGSRIKYKSF